MKAKCSLISAVALALITSYLNVVPAFAQMQCGDPRIGSQYTRQGDYDDPRNMSKGSDVYGDPRQGAPGTYFCDPWGVPTKSFPDITKEDNFGCGIGGNSSPSVKAGAGGLLK